jgi:hypothetical protein
VPSLTLSGNEITDLMRATGIQGDGRAVPGGVGIWEGTTNLCTNGGCETNTAGYTPAIATLPRITSDFKFGAACQTPTSTGAGAFGWSWFNAVTGAPLAQLVYSFSVWVKGSGATIGKTLTFQGNESGGAFGDAVIGGTAQTTVVLTAAWQRVAVTGTITRADRTNLYVLARVTAAGAGEVYLTDGVQFEQKGLASPYVETNGATAARAASRVRAPSALVTAPQGWFASRIIMHGDTTSGFPGFFEWRKADGSAVEQILCYYAIADHRFHVKLVTGNVVNADSSAGFGVVSNAEGTLHTVIFAWEASRLRLSIDGSSFGNVPLTANVIAASMDTIFDIGTQRGLSALCSDFPWAASNTGTLTDANAAAIAALPNTNPNFGSLGIPVTMVWPAVDATYEIPPVNTVLPVAA